MMPVRNGKLQESIAIVALSAGGFDLARQIRRMLPGACLHALEPRLAGSQAEEFFSDTTAHLRRLFSEGTPIVAICAAGIVIRALAPLLADKNREPPVVAVAEDGSSAVPLLGGHKGANAIARIIAHELGGSAAITTAGDLRLGIALDDPPPGWRIANPETAKEIMAAILGGEPVEICLEAPDGGWLSEISSVAAVRHKIRVTDRAVEFRENELVLHPPVLAIGVGCERGASPDEAIALVKSALAQAQLSTNSVACITSLELKADEPAVHAVADALDVPARFFDAPSLETETPRLLNPSDLVFRETGCHGVAEASALAAAGPDASLIVPKIKSSRVTCAIARSNVPIDGKSIGKPRGSLAIIGIGPGDPSLLSPAARSVIAKATDLVGYGLYLDMLGDWARGERHAYALGEEEARCRFALDRAADGRQVALICSGDPGIYALASLALELVAEKSQVRWNRIALSVHPGISAMQMAAARIGAPLGHDFCAISLSDLLTPWPDIEKRLEAAAAGDFVIALYNPASRRRQNQIERARDIALAHRNPVTPVVLARNLGRPGEQVTVVKLADLRAADIDMLTVVLIGNSHTRTFTHGGKIWVYTPRGYAIAENHPKRPSKQSGP